MDEAAALSTASRWSQESMDAANDRAKLEAEYANELKMAKREAALRKHESRAAELAFATATNLPPPEANLPTESAVDQRPEIRAREADASIADMNVAIKGVTKHERDKQIYLSAYSNAVDIPAAAARGVVFDVPANIAGVVEDFAHELPPDVVDYALAWFYETETPDYAEFLASSAKFVRETIENAPLNTEQEETLAGDFTRTVAAFVVPFTKVRSILSSANKAARGVSTVSDKMPIGTRLMVDAAAGWVADFTIKQEQVLSNLMRENETLAKVIPEALAIGPDDSEWTKRVKGSLEGVPIGMSLDSFVEGLRWIKRWHTSRAMARGLEPSTTKTLDQQLQEIYGSDTLELLDQKWSDTTGGPVRTQPEADSLAKSRLDDAKSRTGANTREEAIWEGYPAGVKTPLTPSQFEKSDIYGMLRRNDETLNETYSRYMAEFRQLQQEDVKALYINFSNLESEEDVITLIREFIEADGEAIREAKRIGRGIAGAEAEAALQGPMTVAELLSRQSGQPLSDTAALRAAMLLDLANRKLIQMMYAASSADASIIDQYNFQKMLYVWKSIIEQFEGAKADASRALSVFRKAKTISAGVTGKEIARIVDDLNGGQKLYGDDPTATQRLARVLVNAIEQGSDVEEILKATKVSKEKRFTNLYREVYSLGKLWSPKTHIKNISGNGAVAVMDVFQRGTTALWRDLVDADSDVMGEVRAQAFAQTMAVREAIVSAKAVAFGGESAFEKMSGRVPPTAGKFQDQPLGAFQPEVWGVDLESNAGKGLSLWAKVHTAPGVGLKAEDEFFKIVNFRGQQALLVYREAHSRAIKEGWTQQEMTDYIEYLMNLDNTPKWIIEEAGAAAERLTFTNQADGKITKAIRLMRENPDGGNFGAFGSNLVFSQIPYLNTPANFFNYTLEFTPGMGPISKQWRQDWAAGGAKRDMAIASQVVGGMIFAGALDLAQQGLLIGEGPSDPGLMNLLREAGGDKNTFYIPPSEGHPDGQWKSFNDLDQHALVLTLAAQYNEMLQERDIHPEHFDAIEELTATVIFAIMNSSMDRAYMQNAAALQKALMDRNEPAITAWVQQTMKGFIPMNSAVSLLESFLDPTFEYSPVYMGTLDVTEWDNPIDIPIVSGVGPMIPWVSRMFPKKKDRWGRDWVPDNKYADRLLPFRTKEVRLDPITKLQLDLGMGHDRLRLDQSFPLEAPVITSNGVVTNQTVSLKSWPRVFERYQELAGSKPLDIWGGMSTLEYLNNVVVPEVRNMDAPRDTKINIIRNIIRTGQNEAKRIIMDDPEFSEFQGYVHRMANRTSSRAVDVTPGVNATTRSPRFN